MEDVRVEQIHRVSIKEWADQIAEAGRYPLVNWADEARELLGGLYHRVLWSARSWKRVGGDICHLVP